MLVMVLGPRLGGLPGPLLGPVLVAHLLALQLTLLALLLALGPLALPLLLADLPLAPQGDAAHQCEGPHPDERRPRQAGHIGDLHVLAAHEGMAGHLDLDALRNDDLDAAHDGDRGDRHLRALDLAVAEIEFAAAHDGDRVHLLPEAPPALLAVAAHDPDRPPGHGPLLRRSRPLDLAGRH